MKEKLVVQGFENNLRARNRTGTMWHVIFQASTTVGIIALIALLFNVSNGAFGYVAYEARVEPDTFSVAGVLVEDPSKEQLVSLLQSTLSSGAYNKLDNETPCEARSLEEVYQLVIERIIKPKVVEARNLWSSLTQVDEMRATVAQGHPKAGLEFVSWLTSDFVTRPQTSEPL